MGSKIQLGVSEIYLSIWLSVVILGVLCIRIKYSNCSFHRYTCAACGGVYFRPSIPVVVARLPLAITPVQARVSVKSVISANSHVLGRTFQSGYLYIYI